MASNLYREIRSAIEKKQQVIATYSNHRREMCPHAIGIGPSGDEQAIFFQFAGTSSKGDASLLQEADRWRCLKIVGLSDVEIRDGDWHTGGNHSRSNTCIAEVDLEVDY